MQSFVLALLNICAIIVGFAVFVISRIPNQLSIQIPAAIIISVISYIIWCQGLRIMHLDFLSPWGKKGLIIIYVLALVWSPIIFVPLHYFTQGYLTSFGNVLAIWLFQIPTNFLTLLLVNRLIASRLETTA